MKDEFHNGDLVRIADKSELKKYEPFIVPNMLIYAGMTGVVKNIRPLHYKDDCPDIEEICNIEGIGAQFWNWPVQVLTRVDNDCEEMCVGDPFDILEG